MSPHLDGFSIYAVIAVILALTAVAWVHMYNGWVVRLLTIVVVIAWLYEILPILWVAGR